MNFKLIYKHIAYKIHDHGFIRVVDFMGDDFSIVNAARISYKDGTKKINEDKNLIKYLLRHGHTSPFEHTAITFHVKAPIFVARQWIRHRISSTNEISARYSVLPEEMYIPDEKTICNQSTKNMQGRGSQLDKLKAKKARKEIAKATSKSFQAYKKLLGEDIAREISRITVSLNTYTEFYWTVNAHALIHFIRLRADHHAQYEIQAYAIKLLDILKIWLPFTHDAFIEYVFNAETLSKTMIEVLQRKLKGEHITQENSGLSKREFNDLQSIFKII